MSVSSDPRRYYPSRAPSDYQSRRINPWLIRLPLLVAAGFILLFFILIAALAGFEFMYQDKVYPGVSTVFGLDATGMTREEVHASIQERFTYAEEATFVLHYENQSWEFTASELGVELDIDATVDAIFEAGRNRGTAGNFIDQWNIWRNGYPVSPVITYNESEAERLIQDLATNYINRPVLDATLTISNNRAVASQSQVGLVVDIPTTMQQLRNEILSLSTHSEINLTVQSQSPAIWEADTVAAQINTALDPRGVTFFVPAELGGDAGPWTALPTSIENMLRVERVDNGDGTAHYEVSLTNDPAREFLTQIAPELERIPVNARFVFNEDTSQLELIQNSVTGRALDIESTLPYFEQAVFNPNDRLVPLTFREVQADIHDNVTAAELGITEPVVTATTYFIGSTAARRTNIQVAASRFNGVIIPPHSEFSFNEYLGDVSAETGFEEGLIIYGDQTITGVGGGVCQVSTTAFQAAFYGGFPILERYPHGYRVGYYETGEGPGMDATVYSPIVDFRFMNDTDYHLLIETHMGSNNTLTFIYYSTDVGRTVTKEGPYVRNVRQAPPPIYRATPGVTGTIQVDYAVAGAEVYVYRTVTAADGTVLIDNEEFFSNYIPWPAQYQVPPGDSRATR